MLSYKAKRLVIEELDDPEPRISKAGITPVAKKLVLNVNNKQTSEKNLEGQSSEKNLEGQSSGKDLEGKSSAVGNDGSSQVPTQIVNVNKLIDRCDGPLTPTATKILRLNSNEARKYTVDYAGDDLYQVMSLNDEVGIPEEWVHPCYRYCWTSGSVIFSCLLPLSQLPCASETFPCVGSIADVKSILTQKALKTFCETYHIPDEVHPQLPSANQTIHETPTGKIGAYTRFFEYANFRQPLSTFLVNVLRYYHIYISQLSVIAAVKVSHFDVLFRVQCFEPTVGLFRCFYVNSKNKGWVSFSKRPGNDVVCYTKPLDSLKGWNDRFFWVDAFACPASFAWNTRKSVPKDSVPKSFAFNADHYATLVSHPAPFHKYPELFLCLVGISRYYTLDENAYPVFLRSDDDEMDLLSFIRTADPMKVRIAERERGVDEPALLETTIGRVVSLLSVAPARSSSELEASVDRLFGSGEQQEKGDSAGVGHGRGVDVQPVGAARQTSLSVEVRMRAEYNIRETRRLSSAVEEKESLLKVRNEEVESLRAQLLVKEAEAMEAVHLRAEVQTLTDRNAILLKEKDKLVVKVADLTVTVKAKEREVAVLDAVVTSDEQMEIVYEKFNKLNADFVEMALHLEEKFYPHLLTTIASPISKAIEKGMQDGLAAGIVHGREGRALIDVAAFNPSAKSEYILALQELQGVNFSFLSDLESNKDACVESIMDILRLDETLTALSLSLDASNSRVKRIRENIINNRLALHDVFVSFSEPLSATALEGTEGTSGVVPDTTTALSMIDVSSGITLPSSTDDYEVAHADNQEGTGAGNVAMAKESMIPFLKLVMRS
nr:hypothetical protein [Tanacetum cinerariifolium]